MIRFILRITIGIVLTAMLIITTLLALVATEGGTRATLHIAKRFIPGELHYKGMSGTFSSKLRFVDVHYSKDNHEVRLNNVSLNLNIYALLKRHYELKQLTIEKTQISLPEQEPIEIHDTNIKARINNNQLDIDGRTQFSLPIDMNVSLKGQGQIDDYTLDLKLKNDITQWHGKLIGKNQQLKIKTHQAKLLDSKLVVSGIIGDTLNVNWALSKLALNRLNQDISGTVSTTGMINGTLKSPKLHSKLQLEQVQIDDLHIPKLNANVIMNVTEAGHAKCQIEVAPGSFGYPINLTMQYFDFQKALINGLIDQEGARVNLDFNFIKNSRVRTKITAPKIKRLQDFSPQAKIEGRIEWRLSDISFLGAFIPNTKNIKGKWQSLIKISGTFDNPVLSGKAHITEGKLLIPDINAQADNLSLNATINGIKITFDGHTKLGKGELILKGETDLSNAEFATKLHISGNNATLIDLPETTIAATPDITLDLNANKLDIRGNILIPNATLRSYELGGNESLPDDVVIVDSNNPTPEQSDFAISSNLDITLGDNIRIDTEALKGKLIGKLNIQDEPNKPTLAHGQLEVRKGIFEIYGTKFTIDQGKLIYTGGPITNPALNIRAIRTMKTTGGGTSHLGREDVVVGLNVSGSAMKPKYTLFSNPSGYSQADILSYLFTGQPLSNLRGDTNQTRLLMQAASLVNIGGGGKINALKNDIQQRFGLAEMDVETTSEIDKRANRTIQHTALVLGKYLSPKLYIRYSFDVADHTNKFNVRYLLNKNWSIQAESANSTSGGSTLDNGVDILYTIERN